MKKKSNYFERIMQIADYYGYKNANDFAKNALNYNSSEKINRLKDDNNKPSIDILIDISNKFENVNIEWLLLDRGSMLHKYEDNVTNISAFQEPGHEYETNSSKLNTLLQNKDKEIERLMHIIELMIKENNAGQEVAEKRKTG